MFGQNAIGGWRSGYRHSNYGQPGQIQPEHQATDRRFGPQASAYVETSMAQLLQPIPAFDDFDKTNVTWTDVPDMSWGGSIHDPNLDVEYGLSSGLAKIQDLKHENLPSNEFLSSVYETPTSLPYGRADSQGFETFEPGLYARLANGNPNNLRNLGSSKAVFGNGYTPYLKPPLALQATTSQAPTSQSLTFETQASQAPASRHGGRVDDLSIAAGTIHREQRSGKIGELRSKKRKRESIEPAPNATNSEEEGEPEAKKSKQKSQGRRPQKKGETRVVDGQLQWRVSSAGAWHDAVLHHDIRGQLLARAQAQHPCDSYDHPDPPGHESHDQTAFYMPHKTWGPERQNRPTFLFDWGPPTKKASVKRPGSMVYDNKIVLDPASNPVVDHRSIPLTLSSKTPSYKLCAMRIQDPFVEQVDLWARMPRVIMEQKNGQLVPRHLGGKNTQINMPMTRFRNKHGIPSWADREGSKEIEESLLKLYSYYGFDPKHTGSTLGFGRDLSSWETDLITLKNRGKYLSRAGEHAVKEEERDKKYSEKRRAIAAHNNALYEAVIGETAPKSPGDKDDMKEKDTAPKGKTPRKRSAPADEDEGIVFVPRKRRQATRRVLDDEEEEEYEEIDSPMTDQVGLTRAAARSTCVFGKPYRRNTTCPQGSLRKETSGAHEDIGKSEAR